MDFRRINVQSFFRKEEWEKMSSYEKQHYENLKRNYEFLKSTGLTPKLPNFMDPKKASNKSTDPLESDIFMGGTRNKIKIVPFAVPSKSKRKQPDDASTSSIQTSVKGKKNESQKHMGTGKTKSSVAKLKPQNYLQSLLSSAEEHYKNIEVFLKEHEAPNDLTSDEPKSTSPLPAQRYPKRNVPKKSYKEEEIASEDEFLYCEDCGEEYEGSCQVHGPMLWVCNKKVPKGEPERASQTMPGFLSVSASGIRGAGLGIWAEVALAKGVVFGPYEGDNLLKRTQAKKSGYAWEIRKSGRAHHFVEGGDVTTSNWMRFVNCANVEHRQNLVAFQYRKKVYYRAYKPVLQFSELLVWYGDDYGYELNRASLSVLTVKEPPKESGGSIPGFGCDLCGSLFSSQDAMERHRKTHPHMVSDRRHRCTSCTYSTDKVDHLLNHLAIHDGVKEHTCPHCQRGFTQRGNLLTHVRTHTGERPFRCGTCGKGFVQRRNLMRHERIHSGQKPFLCTECGQGFNQQSNLRKHERIHTGQKPYRCPHCPFRSSHSSSLKKHVVLQHTREFPYVCPDCAKGFLAPAPLRRHRVTEHNLSGSEAAGK